MPWAGWQDLVQVLLSQYLMVRTAFYSHDTFGLGHLQRCLKLASAIRSSFAEIEGLLITGSPWAHLFTCPPGFEFARLPPIVKRGRHYQSREKGADVADVLDFRERYLTAILEDYRPDLLIVDNVPCGLEGEILQALRHLRATTNTKCVLALRDVLDRPTQIAREWSRVGAVEALGTLYHEVWVFGDMEDAEKMVTFPGMSAARLRVCSRIGLGKGFEWTGLNRQDHLLRDTHGREPHLLLTGGGGGDADALVTTYVEMLRTRRPRIRSHIVLGPDFSPASSRELIAKNGFRARIDPFVSDIPRVMDRADVVVAMAGYNTTCEIEALGKRALLVPRIWPREEQLLRARKQEQAGKAKVLHPRDLTPDGLWSAIQACLAVPSPQPIHHLGGQNAAVHAARLLDRDPTSGRASIAS